MPAMRVTFKSHGDDLKAANFLIERQKDILEAAGAKKIWVDQTTLGDVTYSRHLMGSCRMGNDPKTSVVNKWNRAHDVPNLFLVDGSSFVTSARQQPTATIQALAYRLADYLQGAVKRGEV